MRRTLFNPQSIFPAHIVSDDGQQAVFDLSALLSDVVSLAMIDGMTKAEFIARAIQAWDSTSVEVVNGSMQ